MRRSIIILAIATAVLGILALSLVDTIPPRSMTVTRMVLLKARVVQYAKAHGELPKSLAMLPARDDYDNSIQDGWKRDIAYGVSSSGVVSFRSLGRDGVIGGIGDDADVVGTFASRDTNGRWNDGRLGWLEDPAQSKAPTLSH